ncbi:XRE family transcriptional regulator [Actinokineospora cianjurensis]|uniref:XRE family transcriptional regulator n=1 Tax=Actinokineospora cianjurensis TaxID=585224 RepID=A0A421B7T4_9PSEU|nr:XRE family transcriptional regulator [Actinokineospora cianjurensis]RLK60566.1 hypothetical protein CLV68_1075 [Actinokineospora cianjurensis]
MPASEQPRTRLEELLQRRHWTVDDLRRRFAQAQAFSLLNGRHPAARTRELYLLAGVASGLMARASHDLGASREAMTQARATYACADNAGHDGLRTWARGLQALIAYWAGNPAESVSYSQRGTPAASRTPSTAAVWLASLEARSLAALGHWSEVHSAVDRANKSRDHATGDELDDLGGLCTFTRARQLYYAADALAWSAAEADQAEARAVAAVDAYAVVPEAARAFGDHAGTRCALAITRISRGDVEGAAHAVATVLDMPPAQRTYGIVTSVGHVQRALAIVAGGSAGSELTDRLRDFTTRRMAIPS